MSPPRPTADGTECSGLAHDSGGFSYTIDPARTSLLPPSSCRAEFPDARIIMLTTFDGDAEIRRALESGARSYLLKTMTPAELIRTYSNREISDLLKITDGTVKNHISNVFAKLGVRDRTRAVLKAIDLGLI
jgi:DNA-binding NarL/FixJ family response regulator